MITLIVVQLVAGFYIGGRTLRFLLLNTPLKSPTCKASP
jgi:hypothetical protein